LFVRAERLAEMREKPANYKRSRELADEWVDLVVELGSRRGSAADRWKSILTTCRQK